MKAAMIRFHDTPPDQDGGTDITRFVNESMAMSDVFGMCAGVLLDHPDVRALTISLGKKYVACALLGDKEIVGAADQATWSMFTEYLPSNESVLFSTYRGTITEVAMILFQIRLLWDSSTIGDIDMG